MEEMLPQIYTPPLPRTWVSAHPGHVHPPQGGHVHPPRGDMYTPLRRTREEENPIGNSVPEKGKNGSLSHSQERAKTTTKTSEGEEPRYTEGSDPYEESTAIRTQKLGPQTPDEKKIMGILGVLRWQDEKQKAGWNRAFKTFPLDWLFDMAEWAAKKSSASPRKLFVSSTDPNRNSGAVNPAAISNFREWANAQLKHLDATGSSLGPRATELRECLAKLDPETAISLPRRETVEDIGEIEY